MVKQSLLYTLEILQRYSDKAHRLTQQDIVKYLQEDYNFKADRRSVCRNLEALEDLYPLSYETHERKEKGKVTEYHTNYWIEPHLSDGEVQLLIDGLLFSKNMNSDGRAKLIKKLGKLASPHFSTYANHINTQDELQNAEMLSIVEKVQAAIQNGKQLKLTYGYFAVDGQLKANLNTDGKEKIYHVNPYYVVANHGFYYLIAYHHDSKEIHHYRMDRILKVKELDEKAFPISSLPEGDNFRIKDYMAKHINMFTGDVDRVTFTFDKKIVKDVRDWFGKRVSLTEISEDRVRASVEVGLLDMELWAQQYANAVKIESPKILVDRVKERLKEALKQYK